MYKKIKPYIISILIALTVGGLSAFLTKNNTNIYQSINKPPLAPPAIIFPIVWTLLFILMGIGSAIIYTKRNENTTSADDALIIYSIQLAVNFFWSIIFFNMQAFLFAFIWLMVLWLLILLMIFKFKKISSLASYLQLPYIIWVTFAGYLNIMVYLLNR